MALTKVDWKKARFERALAAIKSEREYQDFINGNVLPIGEELILVREYLRRAEHAFTENFDDPTESKTMETIRKIAAICIRCMEHHGTPLRTSGRKDFRPSFAWPHKVGK